MIVIRFATVRVTRILIIIKVTAVVLQYGCFSLSDFPSSETGRRTNVNSLQI